jgi:hypothetical protein
MAKMKYPPGYEEEFLNTVGIYARRRMALYEERYNGDMAKDEYLEKRIANGKEMQEKLHQVRAKYGVPDPASEEER